MKKTILSSLILIISLSAFAQGYAGFSADLKKRLNVQVGVLVRNLDLNAGLTFPIANMTKSTVYNFSSGYQINITHKEEDNFVITPSVGVALNYQKEIVKAGNFNEDYGREFSYETLKKTSSVTPFYHIELGKDAYMGRLFIAATYTNVFYGSVGMKIFFTR